MARGLELIGDWWSPLIIRDLFLDVRRFDDLVEDLGISRNLLTRRLKALIEAGVVERHSYQDRPKRWEYQLSAKGRDLIPALLALTEWGDRWAGPKEGRPILFVHACCGHQFHPTVNCSVCGGSLSADTVSAKVGPGGRAAPGTKVLAKRLQSAS
ncbi:winged helix-turn-helix transcriptional regulator [Nitratireductor sp. GCM10026969]|uniref:winged helix-turn-helix transcriptional regulator n=1 Tax=Nitratireductor sp. GCM10026969 TaxID=3252645 RepID=UPI0036142599